MKSKYKMYSEYKRLNFPFLDKIPSSWNIVPLYALSKFRQGKLHEPYIDEDGKFICINSRFVSTEGKKFKHCNINLSPVEKSDILMVMSDLPNGRALAKALYVTGENNYALNQRVCAITPENVNSKFLYYQLDRNAYFLSFDDGSNQTNLSNYDFKKYPVLLPSEQEQQTIANYLDKATAKIDTLIEKQTKLIELLREKRQVVISTAVTRGLDDTVAMKDSGVEWLGEIPEGWNKSALKFQLLNLDFRRIPISASERGDIQGAYPYYGASGIIDYVDDYIFNETTILIGEDGANLLSKSTPLAFIANGKYWVNNHAHILKPKDGLYNFWVYILNNLDLTPVISGSAQPKLTAEALGNLSVVFPNSINEKKQLENYLDNKIQKIDTLITKSTKAIDLLKEKRTALISAAVTGKIDVRKNINIKGESR